MTRAWMFWAAVAAALVMVSGCGDGGGGNAGPIEGFVCGIDGKTYSIEEAAQGTHEVEHRGRCDEPMQCNSDLDCFVGDSCTGWCVPGPSHCLCPGVFEPVCGGDGRNYINACEAGCAGVGVQHGGYCEEPPGRGCVRAGCSAQLCVEDGMDVASTCEWRPVYECYQQATCERQQNGQCGFTPTHELVQCLESFGEGMCRIDPRWQDGFDAECESPQAPGIVGVIHVEPLQMMQLGQPFEAGFTLVEPAIFDGAYQGQGRLFCDGESTLLEGFAPMTPLGDVDFTCSIVPETQPGECFEDADCPPDQFCALTPDEADPNVPEPPAGVCVDRCAVVLCSPGYVCEAGECIRDCRTNGCEPGWTCDYCQTPDGGAEWICLSPEAGACLPPDDCRPTGCNGEICADRDVASPCVALPEFACYQQLGECKRQPSGSCGWTPTPELDQCLAQFDCRTTGCGEGSYCSYCWTSWECIPDGAVC